MILKNPIFASIIALIIGLIIGIIILISIKPVCIMRFDNDTNEKKVSILLLLEISGVFGLIAAIITLIVMQYKNKDNLDF